MTSPVMRTQLKPYPYYRDAGTEFLRCIPVHWQVRRLKTIASIRLSNVDKKSTEGEEAVRLCNYVDVYYHDRITASLDFMSATATADQIRRFSLRAGDVLITKDSESWTDIAVPAVVGEDLPGVLCGYHLAHIRPSEQCYGPFLARALAAVGPRDQLEVAANGITRFGLSRDAISTATIPLPPLPEQVAISRFLDDEAARIDALVAKKERLIELLQEERTALVSHVVTRGLDPHAHLKDSGVEWLGEIPRHWGLTPLKHVAAFENGFPFKPDEWTSEGTPIIRIENLNGGGEFNCTTRELPTRYRATKGDILFGWSGNRGTSFGPFIWQHDGVHYVNQHIFLVSRYQVHRQWLYWMLRAVTSYVEKQAHGIIGMVHVTRGDLGAILVPVVPSEEQHGIAAFLDREQARIGALIAKVNEGIAALRELRTAVIQAAVTGRIDVREAV